MERAYLIEQRAAGVNVYWLPLDHRAVPFLRVLLRSVRKVPGCDGFAYLVEVAPRADNLQVVAIKDADELLAHVLRAANGACLDEILEAPRFGELVVGPRCVDVQEHHVITLGAEKARLLFALMSCNNPHILLLDEPTNHLDVDYRQALVQAINCFEGAVIIVSHDPHVIELTVDHFWIVQVLRSM